MGIVWLRGYPWHYHHWPFCVTTLLQTTRLCSAPSRFKAPGSIFEWPTPGHMAMAMLLRVRNILRNLGRCSLWLRKILNQVFFSFSFAVWSLGRGSQLPGFTHNFDIMQFLASSTKRKGKPAFKQAIWLVQKPWRVKVTMFGRNALTAL